MNERDLVTFLENHALLTPLLGAGASARIWPLMIPQHVDEESSKLPCVVYQFIGETPGYNFCGEDGLSGAELQLDVYSLKYGVARDIARALREVLSGYSGMMGDTRVSRVLLGAGFDLLDPEPGLYRVSQTYSVWYVS